MGDFLSQVSSTAVLQALWLTALASVATVVLCMLLGTPLAWLLARVDFRGRSLLRAAVLVPLVLPPVVAGVALITALGRTGLLGRWLDDWFGVTLPYTTTAVVIAHTFVSIPFYILSVEGALRAAGEDYDPVAASLGADRWTTFRRVTLPSRCPGWSPERRWRGRGRWASSARPSPSPATTLAPRRPCRADLHRAAVAARRREDPEHDPAGVSVGVLALLRNRWLTRP